MDNRVIVAIWPVLARNWEINLVHGVVSEANTTNPWSHAFKLQIDVAENGVARDYVCRKAKIDSRASSEVQLVSRPTYSSVLVQFVSLDPKTPSICPCHTGISIYHFRTWRGETPNRPSFIFFLRNPPLSPIFLQQLVGEGGGITPSYVPPSQL